MSNVRWLLIGAWPSYLVVDTVTAALLGTVAIIVGYVAKFDGPAKWFSLFGAGFGFGIFAGNFAEAIRLEACGVLVTMACTGGTLDQSWLAPIATAATLLYGVGVYGLVRLGMCHGIKTRWYWSAFGWPAWTIGSLSYAVWQMGGFEGRLVVADYFWTVQVFGLYIMMTYMMVTTLALAFSYKRAPSRDKAILAAAMIAYPLAQVWVQSFDGDPYPGKYVVVAVNALIGPLLALFLWSRTGQKGGAPKFVMGVVIAFVLASAISVLFLDAVSLAGFARVFDITLVSYAILRLQYMGVDVTVRWGLSKSTVAAVFVAVFFVVSEVAQAFFGERLNSEYMGIAAAGLLLLAISPLQRLGDRVAQRAVPGVAVSAGARAADVYRRQVQQAWQDGRISPSERLMLRTLRKDLGLTIESADTIEDAVEVGLASKLD